MDEAAYEHLVLVPTTGNGSIAAYSRALARLIGVRCLPLDGCSGSFGRPALGRYSLEGLARDARAAWRLRRCGGRLLHLTSHHLARYARSRGSRTSLSTAKNDGVRQPRPYLLVLGTRR